MREIAMRSLGIALNSIAVAMFATIAQAETTPPAELQAPRFMCLNYPLNGPAFMKGLASGGKWERVDAGTFVYDVAPKDALTGKASHFRLMFIRTDTKQACGDTRPCAILTRAALDGTELKTPDMMQLCDIVVMNGISAIMNEQGGSSSGVGVPGGAVSRPDSSRSGRTPGNMDDPLGKQILEYEAAQRAGKGMPKPFKN